MSDILDRVVGRCKIALASDAELDEFVIVETEDDARQLVVAIDQLLAERDALRASLKQIAGMPDGRDEWDGAEKYEACRMIASAALIDRKQEEKS